MRRSPRPSRPMFRTAGLTKARLIIGLCAVAASLSIESGAFVTESRSTRWIEAVGSAQIGLSRVLSSDALQVERGLEGFLGDDLKRLAEPVESMQLGPRLYEESVHYWFRDEYGERWASSHQVGGSLSSQTYASSMYGERWDVFVTMGPGFERPQILASPRNEQGPQMFAEGALFAQVREFLAWASESDDAHWYESKNGLLVRWEKPGEGRFPYGLRLLAREFLNIDRIEVRVVLSERDGSVLVRTDEFVGRQLVRESELVLDPRSSSVSSLQVLYLRETGATESAESARLGVAPVEVAKSRTNIDFDRLVRDGAVVTDQRLLNAVFEYELESSGLKSVEELREMTLEKENG